MSKSVLVMETPEDCESYLLIGTKIILKQLKNLQITKI